MNTQKKVYVASQALNAEWDGYGEPTEMDINVAIASMIDYLDGVTGDATIELPGAGIMVTRTEDAYSVWMKMGSVDPGDIGEAPIPLRSEQ